MTSVQDHIHTLKEAQKIDREVYQATVQLNSFPEQQAQIKAELETEKRRLSELEGELKKMQLLQKQKEGELAQKEANIKKFEGQLGQVKTNKEYAALQQEIASLKADNSLLEEEIIKVFDSVEAAEEEVKKEKERLKQVEKNFQVRSQEIAEREKIARQVIEDSKKQRAEIVQRVPPEIQNMYDLIIQKKQGLALVKVNGEICGACQLQLRPQLINEIRLAQSLVLCENCSRILYFED